MPETAKPNTTSEAQVVYLIPGEALPREAHFDDVSDARLFFEVLKPRVEQGLVARARLWTAGAIGPADSIGHFD